MKKRIICARLRSGIFLLMLVLAMLIQVGEVACATKVEAGSKSMYPGDTANVPITVKEIAASKGLGAYSLKVTFDPSVVQVQDVIGGASPFDTVKAKNINNNAGEVSFNSYITATQGPTGSITVAYLRVEAVGSAGSSSALVIAYIDLYDPDGNPIPATGVPGSVTIGAWKSSSSITVAVDREELRVDESVTVSGKISPGHAASVTLSFTRPDETRVSKTASSGSDGAYSVLFEPDMAGAWKVSASWPGDANHYGASSSTAKFLVTKLNSSLTVLVSPMVLEPEGSLQLEGFVSPERESAAIKLEYELHEGGWMQVAEVSTNSTGGFSYDWETGLNASGQYEVKASWLGDHIFEGAESIPVLFYVAEDSALSISLSSLSIGLNGTVVIKGEVLPSHAYTDITLSVEAPNGAVLVLTTQTDAAGNYKVSFVPDAVGVWRFESSWLGDFNTHGSKSPQADLQVISAGSSISLQSNVPSVTKGSQITLSGEIEPSPGGATVVLELTRPDSSLVMLQAESTSDGIFSVSYAPDQAGVWLAQASWLGNSEYGGAASRPVSFTADKSSSTLSLSVAPPIPKKGDLVTFEGTLNPATSSGSVEVLMSEDGGETWSAIASPAMQLGGEYSGSWRAEKIGAFCFKAVWKGDDEHSGCASLLITLIIQEGVTSVSVPLADGQETQVVSSTNSSTSILSADPADGRIDIEVSGPNGTMGLMNVFVPDGLLDSFGETIDDVVFSVDGTLVSPEVVGIAGGYLATITYDHSERTISVHYLTHSIMMAVTDFKGGTIVGAEVFLAGPVNTRGMTNGSGSVCFPSMPKGNYTILVYYGGKVGEDALDLAEDKVLTISTVVGKIEAEYSELLEEYADLEQRYLELQQSLATTQTVMYLYLITAVAFSLIYLAVKGQDQIYYFARRFSEFWNDVSARLHLKPLRLRRREKEDEIST